MDAIKLQYFTETDIKILLLAVDIRELTGNRFSFKRNVNWLVADWQQWRPCNPVD